VDKREPVRVAGGNAGQVKQGEMAKNVKSAQQRYASILYNGVEACTALSQRRAPFAKNRHHVRNAKKQ
jgi:hypothetical protein